MKAQKDPEHLSFSSYQNASSRRTDLYYMAGDRKCVLVPDGYIPTLESTFLKHRDVRRFSRQVHKPAINMSSSLGGTVSQ